MNTGNNKTVIESLGVYLPPNVESAREVVQQCQHPIRYSLEKHAGIRERRKAGETEFAIDIARKAAELCLETSKFDASDIELLICCNISRCDGPGFQFSFEPCTAIRLRTQLGCSHAICFDISNACAGMFTAVKVAHALLQSGAVSNALVVSGEYITHLTDTAQKEISEARDARIACLTLGDAGAAITLEQSSGSAAGFAAIDMCTLGGHSDCCVGRATESGAGGAIMLTDSQRIHRVAISQSVRHAAGVLTRNNWDIASLQHFIMHQTAKGAIDEFTRQFNEIQGFVALSNANMIYNVETRANTATTSHFVALWDCVHNGRINDNESVCFAVQASGITLGTAPYVLDDLPSRLRAPAPSQKQLSVSGNEQRVHRAFIPRTPVAILESDTAAVTALDESHASAIALAVAAGNACIDDTTIGRSDIDLIVYCGVHREEFLCEPAIAAIAAGRMSINAFEEDSDTRSTLAFDIMNGGVGFLNACATAVAMIDAGDVRYPLILAAEIEPNAGRPEGALLDRAEAGSAVLLGRTEAEQGRGFVAFFTLSFVEYVDQYYSYIGQTDTNMPYLAIRSETNFETRMLDCIEMTVAQFLDDMELAPDEIKAILPPQISTAFVAALIERLSFDPERWVCLAGQQDLFTSSTTFGFKHLLESRPSARGDLILMINVAAGIQVVCALYEI